MNPEPGQYVKVLFNNGTKAEGIVDSWSDDKSVLIAENRDSILVIQKTKQDVLTVIINIKYRPREELIREHSDLAQEPEKTKQTIEELAELRKELNRQEREHFFNSFRTHEMSQPGSVGQYALPNFSKKPRPLQRSSTQNTGTDVRCPPGLSEMFGGKNKDNE